MKLSEIIKSPDILLPDTYFDYALIKRFTLPEGTTKLVPFNLGSVVLSKETDIQLHPLDRIYIFSRWFFEPRPTVVIKGRVRKPGTYQIPEEDFRIKDVILQAGGLAKDAFLDKGRVIKKKVAPVIDNTRRGLGAHGRIIVRVVVGKMGRVESARVLRGLNPYYDQLAMDAAMKFIFEQGTIKGNPVRFSSSLIFEF
jgi:TonB family protein